MKRSEDTEQQCKEYLKGNRICGVAEFMIQTTEALNGLSVFQTTATEKLELASRKLEKLEHLEISIGKVAEHTQSMDETLRNLANTAESVVETAMSKKHVPISIFYMVVFFLAAWMLVDKLGSSSASLKMSPTEFHYQSSKEENDNARRLPDGTPIPVR